MDYGRLVGVIFRGEDGRDESGTTVEALAALCIEIGAIDS